MISSNVELYEDFNDSHRQPNSDFAQLTEHQTDDPEVLEFKPHWGQFILFCVTLDLSDNLTEMRNMKNSIVCYVAKSSQWEKSWNTELSCQNM